MKSFSINNWNGFALEAGDAIMMGMTDAPEVAYIEADTKVYASTLLAETNAPTGLRRLSSTAVGSSSYVFDSSGGSGITVYVIDSGINVNHTEFGGRATMGVNFVNSVASIRILLGFSRANCNEQNTDEDGHGTHCRSPTNEIPQHNGNNKLRRCRNYCRHYLWSGEVCKPCRRQSA